MLNLNDSTTERSTQRDTFLFFVLFGQKKLYMTPNFVTQNAYKMMHDYFHLLTQSRGT